LISQIQIGRDKTNIHGFELRSGLYYVHSAKAPG
jgi:hypothetical protein